MLTRIPSGASTSLVPWDSVARGVMRTDEDALTGQPRRLYRVLSVAAAGVILAVSVDVTRALIQLASELGGTAGAAVVMLLLVTAVTVALLAGVWCARNRYAARMMLVPLVTVGALSGLYWASL